ncbi:MAG: nucleoside-diphosphate kinase [Candidatus Latescibacterota bacterium]
MERTLLIIKPNVVEDRKIGAVISALEDKGLIIREMRMETLSRERTEQFYEIHRGKPFYEALISFMISGPVVPMALEHEDAVNYVRQVIGSTDPQKAAEDTIRKRFARSLTQNAVHASDTPENAAREIAFFFGHDAAGPRTGA